jgi:Glycine rich protein
MIRKVLVHGKQAYYYTGADQLYLVPSGVSYLEVTLWGAGGGAASGTTYHGGNGGVTSCTLHVTPGDLYVVIVGQGGSTSSTQRKCSFMEYHVLR